MQYKNRFYCLNLVKLSPIVKDQKSFIFENERAPLNACVKRSTMSGALSLTIGTFLVLKYGREYKLSWIQFLIMIKPENPEKSSTFTEKRRKFLKNLNICPVSQVPGQVKRGVVFKILDDRRVLGVTPCKSLL